MKIGIAATATVFTWLTAISTSSAIDAHDWSTYNYDFAGWRYNKAEKRLSEKNVKDLRIKWRFPRKGSDRVVGTINATPSVVNGYVYFGTATHPKFYKLKPNGDVAWTYEIGDAGRQRWRRGQVANGLVPRDGIYSSALVTDDSVYFGDVLGIAYCLDREMGTANWTVDSKAGDFPGAHPRNLIMASPILADGKVIFAGGAYEHQAVQERGYRCCRGRGYVMALEPASGRLLWKYDVGPEPIEFDPPITLTARDGEHTYFYGPSTSSVWSTPSYDPASQTIFFGTDVHNSPRKPTTSDPRNYTPHSAAVIALDVRTGREQWVTQITKHDIWNQTMLSYDPKTGYKDQSIGDTPKLYSIDVGGKAVRVVGVGSKNGGFYVLRRDTGAVVAHTPVYTGPPSTTPKVDPRTLALPSSIGGLQTGCATDGKSVFVNGIDAIIQGTSNSKMFAPPTGGRVTSISLDSKRENWRHERPRVPWVGGTQDAPQFKNCGDPVASGIALANGCVFFTTFTSNKLVALSARSGVLLKEVPLGPVLAGPSVSRARVYIGTGNTQFVEHAAEAYFPKSTSGTLYSFGLMGEDEVDRLGAGDE